MHKTNTYFTKIITYVKISTVFLYSMHIDTTVVLIKIHFFFFRSLLYEFQWKEKGVKKYLILSVLQPVLTEIFVRKPQLLFSIYLRKNQEASYTESILFRSINLLNSRKN